MLQNHVDTIKHLQGRLVSTAITIPWRSQERYLQGDHLSGFKGDGLDYADFRPYAYGDNVRRINWKMLAKRPERPFITQFESERKILVNVLCYLGERMRYGTQELAIDELAAVVTASIFRSAGKTSERAAFIGYDEGGVRTSIGGRRGTQPGNVWLPSMEEILKERSAPDVSQPRGNGLRRALERLDNQRSLVFVIDDFQSVFPKALKQLAVTAARHEVVCLRLTDLRQRELPATPLARWLPLPAYLDVRTADGARKLVLATKKNRQRHAEEFAGRDAEVQKMLAAAGCKYFHFGTEDSPERLQEKLMTLLKSTRTQ
jgi:uncharacterized protein (DUF58 family)